VTVRRDWTAPWEPPASLDSLRNTDKTKGRGFTVTQEQVAAESPHRAHYTPGEALRFLIESASQSPRGIGAMEESLQKEQFSIAYLRAVATVANYSVDDQTVDDDSVDVTIKGSRQQGTVQKSPRLDVQLKCTSTDTGQGDELSFRLSRKNYDDLRDPHLHVPRILVVLCVPPSLGDWLDETPEQTVLRRVAYWRSLRGEPAIATDRRVLHLPRTNRFCVNALRDIMTRIGDGAWE